jgi:hypothetical protein
LYLDDLKWLMHGSSMLWFGFVSSRWELHAEWCRQKWTQFLSRAMTTFRAQKRRISIAPSRCLQNTPKY